MGLLDGSAATVGCGGVVAGVLRVRVVVGRAYDLRGVLLARGDVDDFGLDVMDLDSGLGTDLSFQYGAGVFG